jgi:hypothetical protein
MKEGDADMLCEFCVCDLLTHPLERAVGSVRWRVEVAQANTRHFPVLGHGMLPE